MMMARTRHLCSSWSASAELEEARGSGRGARPSGSGPLAPTLTTYFLVRFLDFFTGFLITPASRRSP